MDVDTARGAGTRQASAVCAGLQFYHLFLTFRVLTFLVVTVVSE
jgi:hypothetical protein